MQRAEKKSVTGRKVYNMERAKYNITCRGNKPGTIEVKTVSGYVFNFSGLRFGITNKTPEGFTRGAWFITELTSGYIASHAANTRKAAIDLFIEEHRELIPQIKKGLEQITTDANPGIMPKYEYLTVL